MNEDRETRDLVTPRRVGPLTFYPVDDFDRTNLRNPATAVVGYTDVQDATTHASKSRHGNPNGT